MVIMSTISVAKTTKAITLWNRNQKCMLCTWIFLLLCRHTLQYFNAEVCRSTHEYFRCLLLTKQSRWQFGWFHSTLLGALEPLLRISLCFGEVKAAFCIVNTLFWIDVSFSSLWSVTNGTEFSVIYALAIGQNVKHKLYVFHLSVSGVFVWSQAFYFTQST